MNQSVSLPSSPLSNLAHSQELYRGFDVSVQRHGSGLSRFREGLRKTSTTVQQKLERKLLQMAEAHMEVPLPLTGPKGLIFHVADLPGQHTRESVTQILYQSIAWLKENPDRGESPFDLTRCRQPTEVSQVSNEGVLFGKSNEYDYSITQAKPASITAEMTRCKLEGENWSGSDFSNDSIDFANLSLLKTDIQQHSVSISNQISSKRGHIHPDLAPRVSYFESQAKPSSSSRLTTTARKTRRLLIQHPSIANHGANRGTDSAVEEQNHRSHYQNYEAYRRPQTNLHIRRKPVQNSGAPPASVTESALPSPRGFLGTGLRPILPSTFSPKSVAPATASQSTEFIDRKAALPTPRQLRQNGDDPNLNATYKFRSRYTINSNPHAIQEHAEVSFQAPMYNSVADKINRFETSVPASDTISEHASMRASPGPKCSAKRLGVYGGLEIRENSHLSSVAATYLSQSAHVSCIAGSPTSYNTGKNFFGDLRDLSSSLVSESDKATKPWDDKDSQTQEVYLSPDDSKSQPLLASLLSIRKGNLRELGGRIIDIRRRLAEQQHSNMPVSSYFGCSRRFSSQRRRTDNNSSASQTAPLYSHANAVFDQPLPSATCSTIKSSRFTEATKATTDSQIVTDHVTDTEHQLPSPSASFQQQRPPEIPLYALFRPAQANRIIADPKEMRAAMARETRRRLLAAADEVELGEVWKRAVETGRDSEIIRKLDFACWEPGWSDAQQDVRERQRRRNVRPYREEEEY